MKKPFAPRTEARPSARAESSKAVSLSPPAYGIELADRRRSDRPRGLPARLQSGVEALSGVSLEDVEVHYDSGVPGKIGAQATASGREIHLARGAESLLAHEVWHLTQQARGQTRASARVGGVAIDDRPALERDADAQGERAWQAGASETASTGQTAGARITESPLTQAAYVFSYLRQQVEWSGQPDSYYRGIPGFVQVEANGTKVWTHQRNVASALLYLRTQAFREDLGDETLNDSDLNASDARGITKIADFLVERYPPDEFEYVFPGASGDLIAAALAVGHQIEIHRIAISDIDLGKLGGLDVAQRKRLDDYVVASLGPVLATDKSVLIVDALSSGASLRTMRALIGDLDGKAGKARTIVPLALNDVGSIAEAQQIGKRDDLAEIDAGGDQDVIYVKKRIYKQKYKEFVPRVVPKTSLDAITSGRTVAPPARDANADLEQQWQAYAMYGALEDEATAITGDERRARTLASRSDVSPEIAADYLKTGRGQLRAQLEDEDDVDELLDENVATLVKRIFGNREDAATVLGEVKLAHARGKVLATIALFERSAQAKHHDFATSKAAILAIIRVKQGAEAEAWYEANLEQVAFVWIMETERVAKLNGLLDGEDDDAVLSDFD